MSSWTWTAAVAVFNLLIVTRVIESESDDGNCGFGKTQKEDIAKISSYNILKINTTYHQDLFPKYKHPVVIPKRPVIVTAVSSANFLECMLLLKHMTEIKSKLPTKLKFVVYDIGLKKTQKTLIQTACNCDIIAFSFNEYPKHVHKTHILAWRPILIQFALKKFHYILWMDTSIRLNANEDLEALFEAGKTTGAVASYSKTKSMIIHTTDEITFRRFEENPCSFNTAPTISTGFILLQAQDHVLDYLMRPWVACALSRECAQIPGSPGKRGVCPEVPTVNGCHQYDQSVFGVIFTRLFHRKISENIVPRTQYSLCKLKIKGRCYKP